MAFLELHGIEKRFGATVALAGADFSVERGEVHALVGENGSGKSTLMRVLAGVFPADAGSMRLDGLPFAPSSPHSARAAGVAMIHQELSLCNDLSVSDNLLLGMEIAGRVFLDTREQQRAASSALDTLGRSDIDLSDTVGSLPIGARQSVEIARALAVGCRVLVLDEPTSSLGHEDAEKLFGVIGQLRAEGIAIVHISHFLDEVRRVGDRFTVLRDGAVAGGGPISEFDDANVIRLMIGREISDLYPRSPRDPGEVLLSLDGLAGVARPQDASLELRRGEVLGIAGLGGSGRTELVRAVFGLDAVVRGEIKIGAHFGPASPARRWRQGVGMLSEDRKEEGLALEMSITDNTSLTDLPFWISDRSQSERAAVALNRTGVRRRTESQCVSELSGGNQQKVAFARLLHHDAEVLLLDEPTRGVDVASKRQIYALIDQLAGEGKAVLFVSSYLPELLGVCDRIAVMSRGVLGSPKQAAEWTQEALMREAVG